MTAASWLTLIAIWLKDMKRSAGPGRAEVELRLYATVFTNAAEGMTITDANSQIVAVNPAFSAISGYAMDDVIGQTQDEGRNTFRFFSSEINTASLSELLLENDLYGALDRGELLMYYSPRWMPKPANWSVPKP